MLIFRKWRLCFVYDWKFLLSLNSITLIGLIAGFTYLYLDNLPYETPEIVISRDILTPKVKTNQDIKVRVVIERKINCASTVHRWIINDDGIVIMNTITPSTFDEKLGKNLTAIIVVPLPSNLPPGQYHMHSDSISDCGKKGTFVATFRDLDFEVVK